MFRCGSRLPPSPRSHTSGFRAVNSYSSHVKWRAIG
jgi:hypothetical protein